MTGDGFGWAIRDLERNDEAVGGAIESLTPREREVLAHIALGCTVNETAQRLGVASSTVQSHVKSIYGKTGARSRAQVAIVALRLGLLKR